MTMSKSSRVVGSIQCASSRTISTGRRAASPASCTRKLPSSSSLRRWKLSASGAWRSSVAIERRSAKSATSLLGFCEDNANSRSSLSSLIRSSSPASNPAACSSCVITDAAPSACDAASRNSAWTYAARPDRVLTAATRRDLPMPGSPQMRRRDPLHPSPGSSDAAGG